MTGPRQLMPRSALPLPLVLALVLGACGGGDDSPSAEKTPTATKTPAVTKTPTGKKTPTPKPPDSPKGINVIKVGKARDQFLVICVKRDKDRAARSDDELTEDLETAAKTLTRAFRANPDEEFRRVKDGPSLDMRQRLLAAALVARRDCGGGEAVEIGDRMGKAIANRPKKD